MAWTVAHRNESNNAPANPATVMISAIVQNQPAGPSPPARTAIRADPSTAESVA